MQKRTMSLVGAGLAMLMLTVASAGCKIYETPPPGHESATGEPMLPVLSVLEAISPEQEARVRASWWKVVSEIEAVTPELDPDRPGNYVTPYSAEQIAEDCPDGTRIQMLKLYGRPGADGARLAEVSETGFRHQADGSVSIARQVFAEEATQVSEGPPITWDELRLHASFPAETTSVTRVMCDGPLGTLECKRYEVKMLRPNPDKPGHKIELKLVFYMAEKLAGPPLRWESWQGDHLAESHTQVARFVQRG